MIERRFRHDPAEMAWVGSARCVGVDPELFFPMGSPRLVMTRTAHAKAICVECPVRVECLEWSLRTAQDAGVWGGLDEEERREIRRQRRRHRSLTAAGR
jgi:WhiB family redox-sensing transcriptional regulator